MGSILSWFPHNFKPNMFMLIEHVWPGHALCYTVTLSLIGSDCFTYVSPGAFASGLPNKHTLLYSCSRLQHTLLSALVDQCPITPRVCVWGAPPLSPQSVTTQGVVARRTARRSASANSSCTVLCRVGPRGYSRFTSLISFQTRVWGSSVCVVVHPHKVSTGPGHI